MKGPSAGALLNVRRDVRRFNLFRKVEIHCVGMGTADSALLRRLAGRHLGRYRGIGVGKGKKK